MERINCLVISDDTLISTDKFRKELKQDVFEFLEYKKIRNFYFTANNDFNNTIYEIITNFKTEYDVNTFYVSNNLFPISNSNITKLVEERNKEYIDLLNTCDFVLFFYHPKYYDFLYLQKYTDIYAKTLNLYYLMNSMI